MHLIYRSLNVENFPLLEAVFPENNCMLEIQMQFFMPLNLCYVHVSSNIYLSASNILAVGI